MVVRYCRSFVPASCCRLVSEVLHREESQDTGHPFELFAIWLPQGQ